MDVAVAMRVADLGRVDVRQPVVRDDLARHVEDQPAERVALVGVGVDAPVLLVEIFVDRRGDVDQRLAIGAQPLVAVAIDDVGARRVEPAGGRERVLDAILDRLDVRHAAGVAVREHAADGLGELVRRGGIEFAGRRTGAGDRGGDLGKLEGRALAVALDDLRGQCRPRRKQSIPSPRRQLPTTWLFSRFRCAPSLPSSRSCRAQYVVGLNDGSPRDGGEQSPTVKRFRIS